LLIQHEPRRLDELADVGQLPKVIDQSFQIVSRRFYGPREKPLPTCREMSNFVAPVDSKPVKIQRFFLNVGDYCVSSHLFFQAFTL
jgi:hypothetical protein